MSFFNFVFILLFTSLSLVYESSGTQTSSLADIVPNEFIVRIHAVGQGNCVTVKFYDEKGQHPEWLIVDFGTSSIKNESLIREVIKKEAKAAPGEGKSKKTKSRNKPKPSLESPSALLEKIKGHEKTKLPARSFKEDYFEGIDALLSVDQPVQKSIKTVVLTHGDDDHTNEIINFVTRYNYQINNLILGGLPETYKLDEKWLNDQLKGNFNLYIPALSFNKLEVSNWAGVLQLSKKLSISNEYAQQAYSLPLGYLKTLSPQDNVGQPFSNLEQVLNFGQSFKIYLLSVNPMHYQGAPLTLESDQCSTIRVKDDSNTDSLVMKIVNIRNKTAVMLTGDATGKTTSTILDNYRRFLNSQDPQYSTFLQTDVYLAAHHGSAVEDCNEKNWIKEYVKPRTVFISNGQSQGHPHIKAYNNFKASSRLIKNTSIHEVDITLKNKKERSYVTRTTTKAIFSTLNSGLLTAHFNSNGTIFISAGYEYKEGSKIEFIIPYKELTEELSKELKEENISTRKSHTKIDKKKASIKKKSVIKSNVSLSEEFDIEELTSLVDDPDKFEAALAKLPQEVKENILKKLEKKGKLTPDNHGSVSQ